MDIKHLMKYRTFGYDGPKYLCYFYFIDWQHISLGLHVHLGAPNIEIHLPFGFIRVGWQLDPLGEDDIFGDEPLKF